MCCACMHTGSIGNLVMPASAQASFADAGAFANPCPSLVRQSFRERWNEAIVRSPRSTEDPGTVPRRVTPSEVGARGEAPTTGVRLRSGVLA